MRAVILAAGRGSRMGEHTADVPKAFLEVGGRTLFERQRAALDRHVDGVTVVLGYRAENVRDDVGAADALCLEDWDQYENAESLRRALLAVDDDVLVLNGDVIVSPTAVDKLVGRFESLDGEYNVVGHLPGVQTEHTAIRCDETGEVSGYGMIEGWRHAGVGVVSRRHRREAIERLGRNRSEWYPLVYCQTPTRTVTIPPEHHVELNRPEDLERARERLPLTSPAGGDVRA